MKNANFTEKVDQYKLQLNNIQKFCDKYIKILFFFLKYKK